MKKPQRTQISASGQPWSFGLGRKSACFSTQCWFLKILTLSISWPCCMLYCRKRLTSGSMWVKAVVRITPPPKQERQETTKPPLEPSDRSTCSNNEKFIFQRLFFPQAKVVPFLQQAWGRNLQEGKLIRGCSLSLFLWLVGPSWDSHCDCLKTEGHR